jgi:hypothetical protein
MKRVSLTLRAAIILMVGILVFGVSPLSAQEEEREMREQEIEEREARMDQEARKAQEENEQARNSGEDSAPKTSGFRDRLSWAFHGSLLIFPEGNGPNRGAPTPILPSPGVSLACRFWDPLSAEASLDLYFTHYGYDFGLDRAIPVEIENRSAFVLGSILGLSLIDRIPIGERFSLRLSGGLAMDMRIVMLAFGLNDADLVEDDPRGAPMQANAARDYFWDKGRWLLPFLGIGFDTAMNEKFALGLDFRLWFPLYRLWTGEDLPGPEGWRFGPSFRIIVR